MEREVGDRLRLARERRGMTQTDLAAKLGVHVMSVTLWENKRNRRKMSNRMIYKAAEALNISASVLLGSGEEPAPSRARVVPMIPTQTVDEVQFLRMYRSLPETLKLVQFAQMAECVALCNADQAIRHDASIDSATTQSTIVGMLG